MSYRLMIEKKAIKELKSLPESVQERIKDKIRITLIENPFPGGKGDIKRIEGSSFWRLRVGDYRVFYDVDMGKNIVFLLSVKHRGSAYRK